MWPVQDHTQTKLSMIQNQTVGIRNIF